MDRLDLIGKRLDFYLKNKGKSIRKFALECETNPTQVQNIINGKVYGIDKLFQIIDHCDISGEWLLFGKGEMIERGEADQEAEWVRTVDHKKRMKESVLEIKKNLDKLIADLGD